MAQAPNAAVPLDAAVGFIPYHDPWQAARERWRDISDNPFRAFLSGSQTFSYSGENGPKVRLSYSSSPPVPYFIGRIDATGLKPNFAYQLKLVGKPVKGSFGWGGEGNEWANERLGYAGRWWCGHPIHAGGTNFDDNHYLSFYKNALLGMEHNMYGYIYMGEFITDENGAAHTDFFGDHPYHISWHSWQGGDKPVWQGGARDVLFTRRVVRGSQYGYGTAPPTSSETLFYENEPGRTQPLTLPAGAYRCRFLITEESYHNPVNNIPEGGYWKTVLATEDLVYDDAGRITGHDRDLSNDVAFAISGDPSVNAMRAIVTAKVNQPSRQKAQATVQVVVTDAIGRPIRNATVVGFWSGAHNTREISATTNSTGIGGTGPRSDGVAQFQTPEVKVGRDRCFRFIVTDIRKTGRTWNKFQQPNVQACL